ncbi:MAG: hypothetical protein RIT45_2347 [Pseudomonadota bacterium]
MSSIDRRVVGLLAATALLCTAIPLLPAAWDAGYVLDDGAAILENPLAHWPPKPLQLLRAPWFGPAPAWRDQGVSRPLVTLSYALEDGLGLAARGRHIVSWGLAAAGFLLFGLLIHTLAVRLGATTAALPAALAATALAATHPTHVEAIVCVGNRPEPMAALAVLSALWAMAVGGRAAWWALPAMAAALLAKESAIAALLPLALLAALPDGRRRGPALLAVTAAAAAWLAMRLWLHPLAQPSAIDNPLAGTETLVRVRGAIWLVGHAAGRLVAPFGLAPDYSLDVLPLRAPPLAGLAAGASVTAAAALAVLRAGAGWRRGAPMAFATVLGLGSAAAFYGPVSQIPFAATLATADRVLWMPSLGLLGLVAAGVGGLWARGDRRVQRIAAVGVVGWVLAWGAASAELAGDWADATRLAERGVRLAPRSLKMRYNLGRLRLEAGEAAGAAAQLRAALSIAPEDRASRVLLMQALTRAGACDDAATLLQQAAAIEGDAGLLRARLDLAVACSDFTDAARAGAALLPLRPEAAEPIYVAAIAAGDVALAARAAGVAGVDAGRDPRWVAAAVWADDRAGRPDAALTRLLELAATRPNLSGLATQIRRRCDHSKSEALRARCADSWRAPSEGGR